MAATPLLGIGLGLVFLSAIIYRAPLLPFIRHEHISVLEGGEIRVFVVSFQWKLALQLMGVIGGGLVIVGVAQRFGVDSALVVVTVTFIGLLLRHIIATARESVSSERPSVDELRPARRG